MPLIESQAMLSDNQKISISAIRDCLRGKSLVIDGGTWTSECRQGGLGSELAGTGSSSSTKTEFLDKKDVNSPQSWTHDDFKVVNCGRNKPIVSASHMHNSLLQEDRDLRLQKLEYSKKILKQQVEQIADPYKGWHKRTEIETTSQPIVLLDNHESRLISERAGFSMGNLKNAEETQEDSGLYQLSTSKFMVSSPGIDSNQSKIKLQKRIADVASKRNDKVGKIKYQAKPPAEKRPKVNRNYSKTSKLDFHGRDNLLAAAEILPAGSSGPESPKKGKRRAKRNHAGVQTPAQAKLEKQAPFSHAASNLTTPTPTSMGTGRTKRPIDFHSTKGKVERKKRSLEIVPDVVVSVSHIPSRRSKRSTGPKKCHNCKTYQPNYFKCQFFLATGCKCGKHYCAGCITNEYGEYQNVENPSEWHCPSCLGVCKCDSCVRQREKEHRRSQTRSNPRRQAQTTASFFPEYR